MPKRQQSRKNSDRALASAGGNRALRGSEANRTPTHPRPLTERERTLIELYSYCQLEMSPQQFYGKWQVTHEEVALICSRSVVTVQRWFTQGRTYRRPTPIDLRQLALMDFLLEHFEEIPQALFELLCPRR